MVAGRKLGLPLVQAAEMAGVRAELAQLWLSEGRRMEQFGGRGSPAAYRERCLRFAREWDRAAAGTLATLRGYLLAHAKRDPKVCVQLLGALEREYAGRHRPPALPEDLEAPDLAESFAPLELLDPLRAPPRLARITHTAADGSTTTAELAADPLEDRTDAELEHYAVHGRWPEEMPRPMPEALDTEGEVLDPALEETLAAELRGSSAEDPAPPVPLTRGRAEGQGAAPPPLGARIDPLGPLTELAAPEVIEPVRPAPPPPAAAPQAEPPPLRRVDPWAGR